MLYYYKANVSHMREEQSDARPGLVKALGGRSHHGPAAPEYKLGCRRVQLLVSEKALLLVWITD